MGILTASLRCFKIVLSLNSLIFNGHTAPMTENKEQLLNSSPEVASEAAAENSARITEHATETVQEQSEVTVHEEAVKATEAIPQNENSNASEVTQEEEVEADEEVVEEDEEVDFQDAPGEILFSWLRESIEDDKVWERRRSIQQVRNRVNELFDEAKNAQLQEFLKQDGVTEEDFQFQPSDLLKKLRELTKKFLDKRQELRKNLEKSLNANLLAKRDILDEMRRIMTDETDIPKAAQAFREAIKRWREVGPIPKQAADEIYSSYRHFNQQFHEMLKVNRELHEMDIKKSLETREGLIKQAEDLLQVESIRRSLELLIPIRKEWREAGYLPDDVDQQLFERFKAACDALYARRDAHRKEQDLKRQANLEIKTQLCAEVEALAEGSYDSMKDWKAEEPRMLDIENRWRSTGPVPKAQSDEVWDRFRKAKRQFHKHRYELMKEKSNELSENLKQKMALIEQAEALKDSTDWKETTAKLIKLQKEWKAIGPVQRKKSEAVWERFRAACDHFFQAKDAWFGGKDNREKENLEAKQALIEQLKSQEKPESEEAGKQVLQDLQKAWDEIGFVPAKNKREIEQEWDAARKEFLAAMGLDPAQLRKAEYSDKLERLASGDNPEGALTDERSFLGNRVRKLEEELAQVENNLGFFNISKGNEGLQKQFDKKIERLKREISIWQDRRLQLKHFMKQKGL